MRDLDVVTLSAISFGLETSTVCIILLLNHFLFDIIFYMISHLLFLLQVSPVSGGQCEGVAPPTIDKGKVIICSKVIKFIYR